MSHSRLQSYAKFGEDPQDMFSFPRKLDFGIAECEHDCMARGKKTWKQDGVRLKAALHTLTAQCPDP